MRFNIVNTINTSIGVSKLQVKMCHSPHIIPPIVCDTLLGDKGMDALDFTENEQPSGKSKRCTVTSKS